MSDPWMDRLAAGLAAGGSRRRTLQAALGVGVGAALTLLGTRSSQAANCKDVNRQCAQSCAGSTGSSSHGRCILDCLKRGGC